VGLRTLKIKNYANHVKEFLNRVKLLHPRYKTTQSSTGRSSDKNNRSDGPKPLIGFAIICFIGLILIIGLYEVFNNGTTDTSKYNDKYISFDYPSYVNVNGGNNGSSVGYTDDVVGQDSDSVKQYFEFTIQPVSSDYPADLEQGVTITTNELGTPENTGNTTIDGNKAVYMEYPDQIWYYTVKGNMTYDFMFNKKNFSSDSEIQDILKTIQIN
jgi:hypothetical protein